jgi:hypothetical protein
MDECHLRPLQISGQALKSPFKRIESDINQMQIKLLTVNPAVIRSIS